MKEMVGGCCVCSDERGWDENPLVYCDGHGCNVAVHQGTTNPQPPKLPMSYMYSMHTPVHLPTASGLQSRFLEGPVRIW